ncbi:Uncharacterized protein TCM_044600 [Theobroma cacao]|uniref:Uncharacterized protein n=1 Tax=Theobroma cacao TaxID=3641 RepID=A0A061FXD2_THECC|nr:Uncharacterized protein TCM_044600 [Theobroma cacao]
MVGVQTTRTHIYKFGNKTLDSKLLASIETFESACGLTPSSDVAQAPLSKIQGYHEMKVEMKQLHTQMLDIQTSL